MRLLFIASGLRLGGAEVVLLELLRHLDRREFAPTVISLTGGGDIADRIAALGVPVITLDMRRRPLGTFRSLVRQLRALRPDVVQTWMYHGDLFGSLAARLAGVRRIVWGLHNSTLSAANSRRSTHLVRRVCVWLSHRVPRRIVSCSVVARDVHLEIGYASAPFVVIGNGFDVERFRPAPAARAELRAELGLASDTPVVLAVGRDDPQKDHPNFVRAAAIVRAAQPRVHFVMVGTGLTPDHARISALAREHRLSPVLHLLGPRHDVPQLMAAADLVVLASAYGE
ncbi:MAG: glycosyltransferase, partial [Rubrivivax sp.]